jgi:5-methylcytosine-specific restriction endonuclease McrA
MSHLDRRRARYVAQYGLPPVMQNGHVLTQQFMDQLDRCKDDAARRILLGVSVKQPRRKEKGIIRHRIFERSRGFCEECHVFIQEEAGDWRSMHLSHTKSKGAGGDWSDENLKALCLTCHLVGVHMGGKVVPQKETIQ